MKKTSNLLTGLGLTFLGLALLGVGGYFLKERMVFYRHSVVSEGIVVEVKSSRSNSKTYYHPIIAFDTQDGNTFTFTAVTGSTSTFDFNQGDTLKVRYTAENPSEAKIDGFLDLWSLPITLLISGIVILLSGAVTVYQSMRRSNSG